VVNHNKPSSSRVIFRNEGLALGACASYLPSLNIKAVPGLRWRFWWIIREENSNPDAWTPNKFLSDVWGLPLTGNAELICVPPYNWESIPCFLSFIIGLNEQKLAQKMKLLTILSDNVYRRR
jgi:hypothetical protein